MSNKIELLTTATNREYNNLGLIISSTVMTRNMFGNLGASLRTIVGGKVGGYIKLLEKTRHEVITDIIGKAEATGADAIIGFSITTSQLSEGMSEIIIYGTAVSWK